MLIAQISDSHIARWGRKTFGIAPMAENLALCIDHINQLEPKPDLVLMTGDITNEGLLEAFKIRNTIMYTVVGAILLVAGFGIFNIVSTIVHEKARDIAILKSLGFQQHAVMQIFVLEGLAIGILGSLAGSALGYSLCRLLASLKFEIKGGFMEGKVVSLETVNALASIPALPVLQAQVLGTMLAPISALACVLKQIAEKDGAPAEEAAAE